MKVKVLVRNPDDYLRETKQDIHKLPRNFDPVLHPLEAPREYTRAMNAVKLSRVFAMPFIGCLEGHRDGISCIGKHPARLSWLYSGAYDGEMKLWDVARRKVLHTVQAHDGFVRAMTFCKETASLYTVGDDKLIKMWKTESPDGSDLKAPVNTILTKSMLTGVSHHRSKPILATCGEACNLWEHTRAQPIKTFQWGVDSLQSVKFNLVEENILAACGSDRSIILYDMRESAPLRKVILQMRSNTISWNPMEAFHFTAANEDYKLYTFDMRRLNLPLTVHKDHTSAVIDVDYSPTGKEFVSASYDKTIRIYEARKIHSRDIYHTKRMQRMTSIAWSLDDRYIYSGSDEMNIRIWKARASEKLGVMKPREKNALQVNHKLIAKFANHPAIKRINNHRQVPKHVYNATNEMRSSVLAKKRKEFNVSTHTKRPAPPVPEIAQVVVSEQ
uniref:DDB1- and CUL4-associated factor 13 n=1 Tax=Megafenestra aurita TaxID=2291010 RepID=A0A4Y7NIC7_9CRUS|nr:EOG090X04WU [Megafenestra aurita]SVE92347.1 EOG090X04WU [Megafenestra aurita]